jgi:hypothetical protein
MTERRGLYRKIIFLALIAVLLVVQSFFSQPASVDSQGNRSAGGVLAQKRDEYQLSQASLGEIDPTSETMKLATLGLRGIAVEILWNSKDHYQKVEDWTSLSAVVDQIIRLQPNFFSVWDFQAHNLSYNISVEFDDYRDRFHWVLEGIDFLQKGARLNLYDPRFLAKIGWFYSNKIGRSDEHVQYRRLLKKMLTDQGQQHTDNWLVGYDWYVEAQKLVDSHDSQQKLRVYLTGQDASRTKPGERAPSPLLFFSEAPMCLINYADTLEEDGTFGDAARAAWETAAREWRAYSQRQLETSHSYTVALYDLEGFRARIKQLQDQIETLQPGERDKIKAEKRASLTDAERVALAKPAGDRTPDEITLANQAENKIEVTWQEVALRVAPEHREEARKLSDDILDLQQKANTIDTYRDIVNYYYWLARCETEPTDDCLAARELLYKADAAYKDTRLFDAADLYDQAFKKWKTVLDGAPVLKESTIMADDLYDDIEKYKKLLGQIGRKFPEHFDLQDVIDLKEGKPAPASEPKKSPEAAADKKP